MLYWPITLGVFLADLLIKRHIDRKYARKTYHSRLHGKIMLEKYYNRGAVLGLLARKPKIMRLLHTLLVITAGIMYYFLVRVSGRSLEKTGLALLLGGGLSNLYDRYTKGHVVDYFRFNIGPKWLRRIVFNISDFCIFIGALLAVAGAELGSEANP